MTRPPFLGLAKRSYARAVYLCLSLTLMLVTSGCTRSGEGEPGSAEVSSPAAAGADADSVFAYLSRIDRESFREALSELDQRSFTRATRTEQFDDSDRQIAYAQGIVRHHGSSSNRIVEVIEADSSGAFDFGYLNRFVSSRVQPQDLKDTSGFLLTDDAAYLSPRHYEAFSYRTAGDTILSNLTVRMFDIRARPDAGENQNVRRVRLYVDPRGDRLVGLEVVQADGALWFREESTLFAAIQPSSDGGWLPSRIRVDTRLTLPFRPTQRFRTDHRVSEGFVSGGDPPAFRGL